MWHVCREGDELSRCIGVYELNLFDRCMKSMQLGGGGGGGEQKGWRSRYCWWARNARARNLFVKC